jgi:hypothetical protein
LFGEKSHEPQHAISVEPPFLVSNVPFLAFRGISNYNSQRL